MSDGANEHEVVRWYTRARKFPQLIGRFDHSTRIPGGPYTVSQAISGAVVAAAGLKTLSWWGQFSSLMNIAILTGAVAGTVIAVGKVSLGSVSPLVYLEGAATALSAPSLGRIAGQKVRRPAPVTARFRVSVHPLPTRTHVPAPALVPTPAPALPRRPPRPGVPALLAGAASPAQHGRV